MTAFVGALALSRNADLLRAQHDLNERAKQELHQSLVWTTAGRFAIGMCESGRGSKAQLLHLGRLAAVGTVRLDNPQEFQLANDHSERDISRVLRAFSIGGSSIIARILGDFGLVLWNAETDELVAARDAFGTHRLYMTERRSLVAFSSHASLLANGEFDREHMTELLLNGYDPSDRTAFSDVRSVPVGVCVRVHSGTIEHRRFWNHRSWSVDERWSLPEAIPRFRELFGLAVKARLRGDDVIWAQLSGGLDSSSVVGAAHQLENNRLGKLKGTLTLVDTMGRGDERKYVNAVLERTSLPNTQVKDYWLWRDDGEPPPRYDEPYMMYPFYARERRVAAALRDNGARVLLSGVGADHYLTGNFAFLADLLVRGQIQLTARELIRVAVARRKSVWRTASRYLMRPLLPARVRIMLASSKERAPSWISPQLKRMYDLERRMPVGRRFDGPLGRKFAGEIGFQLDSIPSMQRTVLEDLEVEMRYPFLYRPLVEFCLQLPYQLILQPRERKWIQRLALEDLLPDLVRNRQTKSSIGARVRWSLVKEREIVAALTRDSLLADLGCVIPSEAVKFMQRLEKGSSRSINTLIFLLSLETWLRVQTGTWSAISARREAAPALYAS